MKACGKPCLHLHVDGTPIAASHGEDCPVCLSIVFRSFSVVGLEFGNGDDVFSAENEKAVRNSEDIVMRKQGIICIFLD